MRSRIAESILRDHSKGGLAPQGGEITVKADLMLCDDFTTARTMKLFHEMGGEVPLDKNNIIITCEHFTPPSTLDGAQFQHEIRTISRKWGISGFHELGQSGIGPFVALAEKRIRPGMMIVGTSPVVYSLGGLGCYATAIGAGDMAALWRRGTIYLVVPSTIGVHIKGPKPDYIDGADIGLAILKNFVSTDDYHAFEFHGSGLDELTLDERLEMTYFTAHSGASVAIASPSKELYGLLGLPYDEIPGEKDEPDFLYEIEIDLNELKPMIALPPSAEEIITIDETNNIGIDLVIIGGGLGGSLQNLRETDRIMRSRKPSKNVRVFVYPSSSEIMLEAVREGIIERLIEAGVLVCAPGRGAEGFGHRGLVTQGERVLINGFLFHEGRLGHVDSEVYLGSTRTCAASAIAGKIISPEGVI